MRKQSHLHKSNGCNDKLADRLSCGRPMVQGEIGQTDTYLSYSFSNKRETS